MITKPLICSEFPQRYYSVPPSLGSLRKILCWVLRLDLHNFLEDKNLSWECNPSGCEQKCYFKLAFNLQAEQLSNLLQVRSTNLSKRLKSLHLLNHFCGNSLWSTSTKICRQFWRGSREQWWSAKCTTEDVWDIETGSDHGRFPVCAVKTNTYNHFRQTQGKMHDCSLIEEWLYLHILPWWVEFITTGYCNTISALSCFFCGYSPRQTCQRTLAAMNVNTVLMSWRSCWYYLETRWFATLFWNISLIKKTVIACL